MSSYFTEGRAWSGLSTLESELDELDTCVAIEKPNARVYSTRISLSLFQAAAQCETFFKHMLSDPALDESPKIDQVILGQSRAKFVQDKTISISEFRKLFEPYLELSRRKVSIGKPFLGYTETKPFRAFSKGRSPLWWRAYNSVKHDLFKNRRIATLQNLLEAMAGLFLLNALHRPNQPVLILENVIREGQISTASYSGTALYSGMTKQGLWEKLAEMGQPQAGQPLAYDIWARSKYFAVILMERGNWV